MFLCSEFGIFRISFCPHTRATSIELHSKHVDRETQKNELLYKFVEINARQNFIHFIYIPNLRENTLPAQRRNPQPTYTHIIE